MVGIAFGGNSKTCMILCIVSVTVIICFVTQYEDVSKRFQQTDTSVRLGHSSTEDPKIQNIHHQEEEAESKQIQELIRSQVTSILYGHVGKTGGDTLDHVLASNCEWKKPQTSKCLKKLPPLRKDLPPHHYNATDDNMIRESKLSELTLQTYHVKQPRNIAEIIEQKNISTFLFTLRHPLHRIESAYNCFHPDNFNEKQDPVIWKRRMFYRDCFTSLDEMAGIFAGTIQKTYNPARLPTDHYNNLPPSPPRRKGKVQHFTQLDCRPYGLPILQGPADATGVPHFQQNYGFYYNHTLSMYPEKGVLAIRTEHLWDDVQVINAALGGNNERELVNNNGKSLFGVAETHRSGKFPVHSKISDRNKIIFCCYLKEENRMYEQLIRRAMNLKDDEKKESLQALYHDCGMSIDQQQNLLLNDTLHSTTVLTSGERIHTSHPMLNWDQWWSDSCESSLPLKLLR